MTDRTVVLQLPWPPSVNRIWRAVLGRILLSKPARLFKTRAANTLPVGRVNKPLAGRLLVWLEMHPPEKLAKSGQVWDIANREKLLCDVLTAQRVWLDDSQIDAMVILRRAACKDGKVVVTIHTINDTSRPL